jgi:hypothetical protein
LADLHYERIDSSGLVILVRSEEKNKAEFFLPTARTQIDDRQTMKELALLVWRNESSIVLPVRYLRSPSRIFVPGALHPATWAVELEARTRSSREHAHIGCETLELSIQAVFL